MYLDSKSILLCGGDKSTQAQDIDTAKEYWQDYKSFVYACVTIA
ncbi:MULTISPECIES: hypothetical protein [Chlorogloeopsis]|nr:hypothetical protein [Chlorogloeopsis fritschii]